MNLKSKLICSELLQQSIEHGFGSSYDLPSIAKKLGITEELYNRDTESGLLWGLGINLGEEGLIDISPTGGEAAILWDMRQMVEVRSKLTPDELMARAKTVTIVYEVTDLEALKKVDMFGLEHNGLKSFAVSKGNVLDHAESLESQLIDLGATPVQPIQ